MFLRFSELFSSLKIQFEFINCFHWWPIQTWNFRNLSLLSRVQRVSCFSWILFLFLSFFASGGDNKSFSMNFLWKFKDQWKRKVRKWVIKRQLVLLRWWLESSRGLIRWMLDLFKILCIRGIGRKTRMGCFLLGLSRSRQILSNLLNWYKLHSLKQRKPRTTNWNFHH